MHPDRHAVIVGRALEDREEFGIVERAAVDVGEDLDAARAEGRSISSSDAGTLLSGSAAAQAGNLSGRASQMRFNSSLPSRASAGESDGPAMASIGGLASVSTC
jgi:hypothetical protein